MDRAATVTHLAAHAAARHREASAAATEAARSQALYERIIERAEVARASHFQHALERGLSVGDLAEAVGLKPADIEAIVPEFDDHR